MAVIKSRPCSHAFMHEPVTGSEDEPDRAEMRFCFDVRGRLCCSKSDRVAEFKEAN